VALLAGHGSKAALWAFACFAGALIAAVVASAAEAAFPGKNGRIAYQHGPLFGDMAIFSVTPGGGHRERLTRSGTANGDASWSPNGKRIAFDRSKGGDFDIFTMRADGRRVRRLTRDDDGDIDPPSRRAVGGSPTAARARFT
jgi:hypothetical protein